MVGEGLEVGRGAGGLVVAEEELASVSVGLGAGLVVAVDGAGEGAAAEGEEVAAALEVGGDGVPVGFREG